MSAIFGETLTFGQEKGPEVRLVTFGDENYARYETTDGFTAIFDEAAGQFCYALLEQGYFKSSGVPVTGAPPSGLRRHLEESETVRHEKHNARRKYRAEQNRVSTAEPRLLTLGPNEGLLEGRQLSIGTVRGLTILVEFQDVTSTVIRADVEQMLNGQNYTANGNFCSAREYFRIVSSNKLDYTNDVVGPFKLSRNRAYYFTHLLVKEALDLAVQNGVDLTRYDSRGEGIIDALNILYAGQTQYNGDLWPHNSGIDLQYGNVRTNLYLLTSMGRHSGDLSIGTFCHENGHLLCRFPDMYDYGERDGDGVESAGIGHYCLMGAGNHLNNGRTPAPVCAYLRDLAGWCDREVSLQSGSFEAAHGDYRTVMRFETDKLNEYFIVENRSKLGLDQHLPASGLAVYHCDTRGSNEWQEGSSTRHYQCALLQADGHLDLERNINQGDGTDLFGVAAGIALSHATNPSSRQWDGADSGLLISQIDPPGSAIKFTVGSAAQPASPAARGESTVRFSIPDNQPQGVSSTIKIVEAGQARNIKVGLNIAHTYIGDLVVELVSPGGARAVLHNRTGEGTDNLVASYDAANTPALAALAGQNVQGHWTLNVQDLEAVDNGTLNGWTLEIGLDAPSLAIHQEISPNLAIPDNTPAGVSSTIAIPQAGTLRKLKVSVNITHTYIGDLKIELVSPGLRAAVLHGQLGGSQDNLVATYDSDSPGSPLAALIAQPIQGNWVLRIADIVAVDAGRLNKWSLEMVAAP